MSSANVIQHMFSEFLSFSCTWGIEDYAGATYGGVSPIFKDRQNNEWQLKHRPTTQTGATAAHLPSKQRVEFILSLKKFGPCVGKNGVFETMVSIYIMSPNGKSLGYEFCQPKIEEAKFTADNRNYMRICFENLTGNLQAILSGEKQLKIRCQIWTQKSEGTYGIDVERCSLPVQLKRLFHNRMFHDVNILVEGQLIPAHKAILAARSVVFQAMFDTNMLESLGNQVTMVDFSESVVRGMLEFIYTDKTTINVEDAEEWLRISDMYELTNLKDMVDSVVIGNLNVENAVNVVRWAQLYKRPSLWAMASTFIKKNWTAVTNGVGFMDFTKSDPEGVVELLRSLSWP